MIFGDKISILNELEIDGKKVDDDDETTDYTADDTTDNDNTEDDTEDMVTDDEVIDDGDDTGDDDTGTTDYTQMDDGGNTGETDTADGGDIETTDGGDDANTTDGGDNQDNAEADNTGDETDDGSTDDNGGTDLKSLEKTLFADLTPEQMSIKNSELMQNYIDLYETLNHIFDNINKIPKDYNNTRVLSFITDKILDLKDMVNSIITTTYGTKTYVENLTVYKQCLLILKQVDEMLKGLNTGKPKENG